MHVVTIKQASVDHFIERQLISGVFANDNFL